MLLKVFSMLIYLIKCILILFHLIYFKMGFVILLRFFQHHYSSLQCYMILQKSF